jgi:hypothetical protein
MEERFKSTKYWFGELVYMDDKLIGISFFNKLEWNIWDRWSIKVVDKTE